MQCTKILLMLSSLRLLLTNGLCFPTVTVHSSQKHSRSYWEPGFHTKTQALLSLPRSCYFSLEAFQHAHIHIDHSAHNLLTSSRLQLSVMVLSQYLAKLQDQDLRNIVFLPHLTPQRKPTRDWDLTCLL